jgi:DNA end-binding protein Ku
LQFKDNYQEGLLEIIEAKLKGKSIKARPLPQKAKVINIMDALKRSLKETNPHGVKKNKPHKIKKTHQKIKKARS